MKLDQYQSWIRANTDVLFDLIRIYLGIGLFVKGIVFMQNRDYLMELLQESGTFVIVPVVIAHYVIPAHFAGGLLLAVGLITRVAALVQLPILIGAVFWIQLPKIVTLEERQGFEFTALVLFLTLLVFAHGPGRWSVDYILAKKAKE